jgi:uncharacterized protein DUF4350
MRERLATLSCALGALLLFGTLFLRTDTFAGPPVTQPTTAEAADNGLLGAMSWLRGEGVRTLSLRERFGSLAQQRGLAPRGNLLIVSLPAVTAFRREELVALDRWIRDGNTLLVLAALRDRPAWAPFPFTLGNDLQLLTGLSMRAVTPQKGASRAGHARAASARAGGLAAALRLTTRLSTAQQSTLLPNRAHPLFTGVARAVGFSDYVPFGASAAGPRDGFALSLAHESDGGADAFWIRPADAGTIIVSGFASLFSNRALGVADNARLLANLIAGTVATDGSVLFDDEHQGLSANYDPTRFYRDSRLYATLAVIAAVWLTWVLGGTRLRVPLRHVSAPREAELVRTTGLFLARVLRPAAAARRLFEQFLRRIGGAAGRGAEDPARLWQWLERHPRLTRSDVQQLHEWQAAAAADRRVPLIRLHNLIIRTERHLAQ